MWCPRALGAIPPFGNLYGLRVHEDASLLSVGTMAFTAGSRRESLTMRHADYARLVQPAVGRFTARANDG